MADSPDNKAKWPSYTMVDPRMRKIYFQFYQETYKSSHLDRKTKELIAIAASLATHCKGCLQGHIKKALKYGATKEELSETIAITMGVSASAHSSVLVPDFVSAACAWWSSARLAWVRGKRPARSLSEMPGACAITGATSGMLCCTRAAASPNNSR